MHIFTYNIFGYMNNTKGEIHCIFKFKGRELRYIEHKDSEHRLPIYNLDDCHLQLVEEFKKKDSTPSICLKVADKVSSLDGKPFWKCHSTQRVFRESDHA